MSESQLLDTQLGEAARMIAVALCADYGLSTIFEALSHELPEPAGQFFAGLAANISSGASIESALASHSSAETSELAAV